MNHRDFSHWPQIYFNKKIHFLEFSRTLAIKNVHFGVKQASISSIISDNKLNMSIYNKSMPSLAFIMF